MGKIYTFDLSDNFIDRLTDFIEEEYVKPKKDLSRLAIAFGGKRPVLFLKRQLASKINAPFFSPSFFSIDEFINYMVQKEHPLKNISDLEFCYLIFQKARELGLDVLKGRDTFASFLPWAREILSFMEHIDLQDISVESLRSIELNAEIGYSVPEDINILLENIITLRKFCHEILDRENLVSRGFLYLKAAKFVSEIKFEEFDQILFCGFFSLHRTECQIVKSLYDRDLATLFFQGEEREWSVLKKISSELSHPISVESSSNGASVASKNLVSQVSKTTYPKRDPSFQLHLYSGFDTHSQVSLVREILKNIKNPEQAVIVLPEPEHLIPLLSEISTVVKEFNVSLGYPLKRSSFYSLFDFIFKAQLSRKKGLYYTRDYLRTLQHPFVKILELSSLSAVTRVLIHKVEEILIGREKTNISGSLFIKLEDIESLQDLYELTSQVLKKMGMEVSYAQLKEILHELHQVLFKEWESVDNFLHLANLLERFLDVFVNKSSLATYPLNLKMASRIVDLKEELKAASFNQESFSIEEIIKIFKNHLEKEVVAFSGSPLKGLQILGLFETRSLSFEHVIVVDANEGLLPRLRIYEPLIPREVMIRLNLDRLEQEEEIQRYQFMRLISCARQVHLVYEKSRDKEKSRFIEQLIWNEQKAKNSLTGLEPLKASFEVKIARKKTVIEKTPEVLKFLKQFRYSSTSLNTYTRCPLRFYYYYVLGLNEKEDLPEEPENREIGVFIHNFLEEIYRPWIGRMPVIDERFRKHFFKRLNEKFVGELERTMKSDSFLVKKVIEVRLERFLDREAARKDFRDVEEIITLEESFPDQIPLKPGDINFIYKVDRIDRLVDGTLLILDYKTGSNDPMPKALEKIESMELTRESIKTNVKSFQIPLYVYYFHKHYREQKINAVFYNLRTLDIDPFWDEKMSFDREAVINIFLRTLDHILTDITDPAVAFRPDDSDIRYCSSCPFFYMCR